MLARRTIGGGAFGERPISQYIYRVQVALHTHTLAHFSRGTRGPKVNTHALVENALGFKITTALNTAPTGAANEVKYLLELSIDAS